MKVAVNQTVFVSVGGLVADPAAVTAWVGRGNRYLLGQRNWRCSGEQPPLIGLDAWRRAWQSDADSTADDPPFYDPRQWRLLPTSPGFRQTPDGKDSGADVDRLGRPR
jgi:hypothetical protein